MPKLIKKPEIIRRKKEYLKERVAPKSEKFSIANDILEIYSNAIIKRNKLISQKQPVEKALDELIGFLQNSTGIKVSDIQKQSPHNFGIIRRYFSIDKKHIELLKILLSKKIIHLESINAGINLITIKRRRIPIDAPFIENLRTINKTVQLTPKYVAFLIKDNKEKLFPELFENAKYHPELGKEVFESKIEQILDLIEDIFKISKNEKIEFINSIINLH